MKHSCPTRRSSVLDQLGLVGDEHELVALRRREAGDDGAVAADVVDIGDALAAAPGAAIFVRRGELAIAIGADGEDELLAARQLGEACSGNCGGAFLPGLPRTEEIGRAACRERE